VECDGLPSKTRGRGVRSGRRNGCGTKGGGDGEAGNKGSDLTGPSLRRSKRRDDASGDLGGTAAEESGTDGMKKGAARGKRRGIDEVVLTDGRKGKLRRVK
jgi:hypothetical protein